MEVYKYFTDDACQELIAINSAIGADLNSISLVSCKDNKKQFIIGEIKTGNFFSVEVLYYSGYQCYTVTHKFKTQSFNCYDIDKNCQKH